MRWLRFAMCLVWLGITVRLVSIHLFDGDLMQRRVHEQQTTEETIPARPGDILDRHGRLLATSVETTSVYLVPRTIPNPDEVSAKLAPLVDLEPAELETRLRKNADKGFLWLARRLSEETVKAIRQLELPADQIGFEEEFKRFYPNEHLAAHLIGFRNIDGEGRGGVEQKYNS
ncbi:MAG: penicillin-binding protein 2, partial [Planctomycetaceae bacterium]|nr:penicillin-binding protein 2 [Planctomycetaceae bacterium]